LPLDLHFFNGKQAGPIGKRGFAMDIYEFKLNLSQSQLKVGELFGLDIHIDDDDNGNDRDSKWGWFHASKANGGSNVDETHHNPSVMAAGVLAQ
jgi:hypothetical protein